MIVHHKNGFSLIELLIVVAIMSALTGAATLNMEWVTAEAQRETLEFNLKVLRRAIDDYHGDRGVFPPSLEALVQTRYLRDIPVDPYSRGRDTWLPVPSGPEMHDVQDVRSSAEGGTP